MRKSLETRPRARRITFKDLLTQADFSLWRCNPWAVERESTIHSCKFLDIFRKGLGWRNTTYEIAIRNLRTAWYPHVSEIKSAHWVWRAMRENVSMRIWD
jgi:hypothetical protein